MALGIGRDVAIERGLRAKFDTEYQKRAAQAFYPRIATVPPRSEGRDEVYPFKGSSPVVREWLGERGWDQVRAAKFTIVNKLWEASEKIDKTDLRDDRSGLLSNSLADLANSAAKHPDKLMLQLLEAGTTGECFDGQYFFDTDHSWGGSGTQSNLLTFNAANENAVTAPEFLAAFHQATNAILGFKNDKGDLFYQAVFESFSSIMCIVPKELRLAAETATKSAIIGNATNIVLDNPQVVTAPPLSSGTSFYVLDTSGELKPFVFQWREEMQTEVSGLDSIKEKDAYFMTQARYNAGYGLWFKAVKVTFN